MQQWMVALQEAVVRWRQHCHLLQCIRLSESEMRLASSADALSILQGVRLDAAAQAKIRHSEAVRLLDPIVACGGSNSALRPQAPSIEFCCNCQSMVGTLQWMLGCMLLTVGSMHALFPMLKTSAPQPAKNPSWSRSAIAFLGAMDVSPGCASHEDDAAPLIMQSMDAHARANCGTMHRIQHFMCHIYLRSHQPERGQCSVA